MSGSAVPAWRTVELLLAGVCTWNAAYLSSKVTALQTTLRLRRYDAIAKFTKFTVCVAALFHFVLYFFVFFSTQYTGFTLARMLCILIKLKLLRGLAFQVCGF